MAATILDEVIVENTRGLHRVLRTRDIVLLNVAAIVSLRWLSTAAQIGPSSLAMWALGLVFFFIPMAFAVLELSSRLPGEGGLYLWTKAAFGDLHGFIAGWTYWVSLLVYFPTVLLFSAGISLHIGGTSWLSYAASSSYNGIYCLVVLWAATILNIFGLERGKWLHNIGGIATWCAALLILGAGAYSWLRFGPATLINLSNVIPDFTTLATFSTFAAIANAFVGLELGPIVGGEMKDPKRQVPRATLISGFVVAAIYIFGTAALMIALPTSMIDLIAGIPQALSAIGERIGLPFFGQLTAALVTLGVIGTVSAFVTCTARLPYVVGVDRYLPQALGRLHPRYGSPYIALLVQAVLTSLVLLAALSGASIHEAFVMLTDMTSILTLLPLLYIFIAFPVLRQRAAGRNEGITLSPGGNLLCWLAGLTGFATTLLALVTTLIPPPENGNPGLFILKVLGGSALFIGVGLLFYRNGKAKWGPFSS